MRNFSNFAHYFFSLSFLLATFFLTLSRLQHLVIKSKIWLNSYTLIFHYVFSIRHFKTSVGGYLRQLENLGSWHELGTNLFFCVLEKSYPSYFTNKVKMKEHLLTTSALLSFISLITLPPEDQLGFIEHHTKQTQAAWVNFYYLKRKHASDIVQLYDALFLRETSVSLRMLPVFKH